MQLIKPTFEIFKSQGLFKDIERAARTCYKSEDKIADNSATKMVDVLIANKHTAMLEHGTIYLQFEIENTTGIRTAEQHIAQKYSDNKYSKCNWSDTRAYVTTNYRVIIENDWLQDLQYQCDLTAFHAARITVKFICDRGVSHEFVRHRVFSFAQESTRYCNYSKNKFGNEITFIEPFWLKDIPVEYYTRSPECLIPSERCDSAAKFLYRLELLEETYFDLIEEGWKPEQARNILPNSLKTELIMTGFVTDWKHFFELRCSRAAHPQARELAIPLEKEFKSLGLIA